MAKIFAKTLDHLTSTPILLEQKSIYATGKRIRGKWSILRTLIVCKSYHHGNTWKVAETIGGVLNAKIVKPGEKCSSSIRDYDLLGLGSGIYWARFHGDIFDFVENLPEVEGKKAFIFSTSGMRKIPIINGFGGGIKGKLSEKGFEIIGEFSCRGYDTFSLFKLVGGIQKGRPNKEDLREAKIFAERMSEKAKTGSKNEMG